MPLLGLFLILAFFFLTVKALCQKTCGNFRARGRIGLQREMIPLKKRRSFLRYSPYVLAICLLLCCLLLPLGRNMPAGQTFSPENGVTVRVLMYHSIVTVPAYAGMYAVTMEQLERDLAGLQARGYHFVSPRMLLDFVDEGTSLPEKPVLLTFDDGYRNNLTLLPALLEQYDAYAVVAAVGKYCENAPDPALDASPHISMSWEDMALAAKDVPRITLANHSYALHETGPRLGCGCLPGESQAHWQQVFCADIEKMQQTMQEHCGNAPYIFAYPYGQVPPGADELLQRMGIRITLSCNARDTLLRQGDGAALLSMGRFNRDGRLTSETFLKGLEGEG